MGKPEKGSIFSGGNYFEEEPKERQPEKEEGGGSKWNGKG